MLTLAQQLTLKTSPFIIIGIILLNQEEHLKKRLIPQLDIPRITHRLEEPCWEAARSEALCIISLPDVSINTVSSNAVRYLPLCKMNKFQLSVCKSVVFSLARN